VIPTPVSNRESMTSEIIMHSFSATSVNIAINDISLKLDSLDYIFVADSIVLLLTTLTNSGK